MNPLNFHEFLFCKVLYDDLNTFCLNSELWARNCKSDTKVYCKIHSCSNWVKLFDELKKNYVWTIMKNRSNKDLNRWNFTKHILNGVILLLKHFKFWNHTSIFIPVRILLQGRQTSYWSYCSTKFCNCSMGLK